MNQEALEQRLSVMEKEMANLEDRINDLEDEKRLLESRIVDLENVEPDFEKRSWKNREGDFESLEKEFVLLKTKVRKIYAVVKAVHKMTHLLEEEGKK